MRICDSPFLGCVKRVAKAYSRARFPNFLIAEHKVSSLFANGVQRFKNLLLLVLRPRHIVANKDAILALCISRLFREVVPLYAKGRVIQRYAVTIL